ncbi:MAG: tetratricopeptide repeat protein, partial [Planctomycetia bacterium]
ARAMRALEKGDNPKALREADRLVKSVPEVGLYLRGHVYSLMKRYPEALADYDRLLKMNPNLDSALNGRAYTRALAKVDLDGALADVEQAMRIAGDEPAYVDTRGYILYLMGRPKDALADFNKVLDDPSVRARLDEHGWGEVYFHRGLVHRLLGEEVLADADFASARRLGWTIDDYPNPVRNAELVEAANPIDAAKPTLGPAPVVEPAP